MVRPLVGAVGDGHGDGVVVAEPTDDFGIAIGIGVNPWHGILDAERMALCAVDEALRNVVAVGADPDKVALLDNFSWGNPQRATTLGELVAAVDGCCQGALAFNAPFVSGKDSLNNEYMGADGNRHSVPPTLVITAIAHVPQAEATVTADLKKSGNVLLLTGTTEPEFGASHASMVCQHPIETSGVVPEFDANAPQRYRHLHQAILQGLVVACHDCSEGGVAVTIAEMCIGGRLGAQMSLQSQLDSAIDLCTLLFSESLGRHIVEVEPHNLAAFQQLVAQSQIIGTVTDDQSLVLPDGAALSMQTLLGAWQDGQ
jgi:phosphoribosylformylglycinamidine synthase